MSEGLKVLLGRLGQKETKVQKVNVASLVPRVIQEIWGRGERLDRRELRVQLDLKVRLVWLVLRVSQDQKEIKGIQV